MNCANHPERERVSFCQNCGKPLCGECARAIGAGVFCEPCLAARLAAADAAAGASSSGFAATANYNAVPGSVALPVPGTPNPALAALLGFIPGVGAMYNGQYAKGVVHLIVFAVLVSLADAHSPFGILVAGWVFYQVFEAYHTARARRDGTPLPNPFGLNDVGERFGFGRAWPAAAPTTSTVPPAGPFSAASHTTPPATWGAPAYTYAETPIPSTPPYAPHVPPFTETHASPFNGVQSLPRSRFPVGAIWLIVLGLLFFFGSSGFLTHFQIQRLIPFLLIGLGIWLFVRKMTSTGQALTDDGGSDYRLRIFRALRGSVWLILVGVLFFLDSFDILSWGRSWPLFIIVGGLMALFERSAYNAATPVPYGYSPPVPTSQTPFTSSNASPSSDPITRRDQHDQEGS